ncbi:acyl carrier protein [[Clostridium] fimetarium]|uniref:Acyl carrier protein n=1 Tax=[Clostridium] fimetarium TaxID=99656 RepID=A0A1I0RI00_9FIRM|nr:acyl carrier protein [[Clostridium] fimetarium]SEW40537.1 acyl carrier protein [[Clostridium] fimetarium]
MVSKMEIEKKLQAIFQDIFEDDQIVLFDDMNANDIEDWDSLTHIQLIVQIEKSFGIKFTTGEVARLKNVGEFIKLVQEKLL